jgi:hypothetical protein
VEDSLILLVPSVPAPGAPHYLSFNATTFSYSDTNSTSATRDSGIGNYVLLPVDTNYSVLEISFTAPPTNPGIATLDLAYTNYGMGYYTNEADGEIGSFTIEPADDWVPGDFSGKNYSLKPIDETKASTLEFVSSSTVKLDTNGGPVTGTYTVDQASPIGAFITIDITSESETLTAYLQLTYTSAAAGFYEVSDYINGVLDRSDNGTFK